MVETNIEALEAAQARFPGLGITDAVDNGACDGCGDDEVIIYRMDAETDGWCCMACTVAAAFENCNDDEFLKFDRVTDRLSNRPDLHAFLLLERLCPGAGDMVSAAEHDQIWLDVDKDKFVTTVTESDVITLSRCGILWDNDMQALYSFV